MSNHVHLVVIPHRAEALGAALKEVHGRYAAYWNVAHACSGHAWQGRFYSCPMDASHLWLALRYTERNPVRAGLVGEAEAWRWSSAAAHCGSGEPDPCLEMALWRKHWSEDSWRKFLEAGERAEDLLALRQGTHTGRPLGGEEFTAMIERSTQRHLRSQKGGRPRKPTANGRPTMVTSNH